MAQGGDMRTAIRIGGAAGAVNVTRHGLGTGRASVIGKLMEKVELVPFGQRAASEAVTVTPDQLADDVRRSA
jgi:1-phosphofructokinase